MICACYRHTNKVVVIHSYQLYGVRLEGFHSWQRVFFLYLYPFVPDGAEKDCIEIFCENWQNPVKQRITPHFLTTRHSNYYEFTTKE